MRYSYTPISKAKTQKPGNINADKDVEQKEFPFSNDGNVKLYSRFRK